MSTALSWNGLTSMNWLELTSSGILEGFRAKTIAALFRCMSSRSTLMPVGPVAPRTRILEPPIMTAQVCEKPRRTKEGV